LLGRKLARFMLTIFACGVLVAFGNELPAQEAATTATEPEDAERFCPLVSNELAAKAAEAVKSMPQCDVYCSGCGCKGGPGYRSISTDRCVGWAEIVSLCGPPPHKGCVRECEPVVAGCTGRAWVKELAAKVGLAVPFLKGTKRPSSEARKRTQPKADSSLPQDQSQQGFASAECGAKKTCGEMSDCEEARHYLRDCGLQRLDGNGDGIPCNSLCKGR